MAAVGVLVFLNAFFVAAEFALVSLRRSRIEQMVEERHRFGRILLRAKDDPNRFISAAQLGITMASLGLGWIGESTVAAILAPLFEGLPMEYLGASAAHSVSFVISFVMITMFHIVLGEQVPKMVALQNAERTAILTIGPTEACYRVFRPFIAAFTGLTNLALKVLRIEPANEHEGAVTAEELELMVQTSHRAGALEDTERDLLSNVFDFADLSVYQVMIQRRDMVGVPSDSTLDDLLELAEGSPHSRFPVYEESLDNVVGVIHIKDLLRAARRDHSAFDLKGAMRLPLFVPETMAGRLLAEFRRAHTTLAVVIDEYGGTAGLVTIDDVVEEIVGDVPDEFHDQTPSVEPQPDGTTIVAPTLRLDELDEFFDIEVDENGEVDTIGGLVVERLGRLAQAGDVVELEKYRLVVEEVDGVRITKLRVVPLEPATAGEISDEQA